MTRSGTAHELRLKAPVREGQGGHQGCRSCAYYRRCCRSTGRARLATGRSRTGDERADVATESRGSTRVARRSWSGVGQRLGISGDSGCGARRKWRGSSLVCVAQQSKKIMLAALQVCPFGSERPGRKKGADKGRMKIGLCSLFSRRNPVPSASEARIRGSSSLGPLPLARLWGR